MKPYRKVHQWWSSALALLLITGFAPTCNYRYEGVGHGSRGWCGECVKGFGLYADAFAPRSGGSGLTVPRTREFRSNFASVFGNALDMFSQRENIQTTDTLAEEMCEC